MCDIDGGGCVFVALADGTSCGEATLCTEAAVCIAGECMDGAEVICESDEPCMAGYCDAEEGCVYELIQGCEDEAEEEEENEEENGDEISSARKSGCTQSGAGEGNAGILGLLVVLAGVGVVRRERF